MFFSYCIESIKRGEHSWSKYQAGEVKSDGLLPFFSAFCSLIHYDGLMRQNRIGAVAEASRSELVCFFFASKYALLACHE
jgi:hypothetical protein